MGARTRPSLFSSAENSVRREVIDGVPTAQKSGKATAQHVLCGISISFADLDAPMLLEVVDDNLGIVWSEYPMELGGRSSRPKGRVTTL